MTERIGERGLPLAVLPIAQRGGLQAPRPVARANTAAAFSTLSIT